MRKTSLQAVSHRCKPLLLAGFMLAMVMAATPAEASAQPGCNPRVMDAMNKVAEGRVLSNVAIREEITTMPDSVSALVCMGRAAGVSATRGGALFSGSFMNGVFSSVITDALDSFFGQYAGSIGQLAGLEIYNDTGLSDDAECSGIGQFWDLVKERGVPGGIPGAITLAALVAAGESGALPGDAAALGERFIRNWESGDTDGVFRAIRDAVELLPRSNIPDYSNAHDMCAVLSIGGAVPSECPN